MQLDAYELPRAPQNRLGALRNSRSVSIAVHRDGQRQSWTEAEDKERGDAQAVQGSGRCRRARAGRRDARRGAGNLHPAGNARRGRPPLDRHAALRRPARNRLARRLQHDALLRRRAAERRNQPHAAVDAGARRAGRGHDRLRPRAGPDRRPAGDAAGDRQGEADRRGHRGRQQRRALRRGRLPRPAGAGARHDRPLDDRRRAARRAHPRLQGDGRPEPALNRRAGRRGSAVHLRRLDVERGRQQGAPGAAAGRGPAARLGRRRRGHTDHGPAAGAR